ncbi:MAG: hypothetical protein H3C58_07275 [Fimbriimonadaceae bacterium]|nr:hypothetical protein [Fimbriimonadaceae bacterium]
MRSFPRFVFLIAVAGLLVGCGGSGGSSSDAAPFAGFYRAAYNRAEGTVLVHVRDNGDIEVVVNDGDQGTFAGSGRIQEHNGLDVACTGPAGRTVRVVGTLSGSGAGRIAHGTVAGAFATGYTATFVAAPGRSVFEGEYEGAFQGTAEGTWRVEVNATGHAVGMVHPSTGGAFAMSGTVGPTGLTTLLGSDPTPIGQVRFTGRFVLVPGGATAAGVWTTATGSGQWAGGRAAFAVGDPN